MRPLHLLMIQPGTAPQSLLPSAGDFDDWFRRAMEKEAVGFTVAKPDRNEALPEAAGFDGVLMTGSLASLVSPLPWMEATARYLRHVVEAGKPFLGVCFGHQMLAYAFGARVVRNPQGFELGSCEVELTAQGREDPLFAGLPDKLLVAETHEDIVAEPPAPIRVLAKNRLSPVQAIAVGSNAWGVQFHPEMTEQMLAGLSAPRTAPMVHGPQILRQFVSRVARN